MLETVRRLGPPLSRAFEALRRGLLAPLPSDLAPPLRGALRWARASAWISPIGFFLASGTFLVEAERFLGFVWMPAMLLLLAGLPQLGFIISLGVTQLLVPAATVALFACLLLLPVMGWATGRLAFGRPSAGARVAVMALGLTSLAVSALLALLVVWIVWVPLTILPFVAWRRLRRATKAAAAPLSLP